MGTIRKISRIHRMNRTKAYMDNGKIQFVDLVAQYQQIKPEIDVAMAGFAGAETLSWART